MLLKSVIKVMYKNMRDKKIRDMVMEVNGDVEEKRFLSGSVISDELFRMSRIIVSDTLEEKKKPKGR